jgi:hypothetical protein
VSSDATEQSGYCDIKHGGTGKELRFIENAMKLAEIDFRALKPLA